MAPGTLSQRGQVEKENPSPAPSQTTGERSSARTGGASAKRPSSPRFDFFAGLQHILGNQALLNLLNSPRIQTKSRTDATDEFEAEADRAAEFVVQRTRAPGLQRKCAGGDSCTCAKCSGEDEQQRFSSTPARIQRQAKDAKRPAGESTAEARHRQPRSHIVDDEAPSIAPGQMRKSAFLDRLEADVCATADAELAAAGRSTKSCPYIEKWLVHYRKQTSAHIERALVKYAPEAASANMASDYFGIVRHRVRRAVATWAKTGKITEIPPGVSMMPPSEGGDGKVESEMKSGTGKTPAGAAVMKKGKTAAAGPAADAQEMTAQLGIGRALDGESRRRMESAFGQDFSGVQVHTDSRAASLSSQLDARAFTVGSDIAFALGEYRPGSMVGDALLAHELAHVVQQGGGTDSAAAPMTKSVGETNGLEADADAAGVGALASVWTGANSRLANVRSNAVPRLRSGVRLSRCSFKRDLLSDFSEKFPETAELVRKSDSAMALVNRAQAAGVKFGGYSYEGPETGNRRRRSYTVPETRTIYIFRKTDSINAMSDFLLELNNGIRADTLSAVGAEARKGSRGTLTAKQFAYKTVEVEIEAMLSLGEVWIATKKQFGSDKKWDQYDEDFFVGLYRAYKAGTKKKEGIIKEVLQWPHNDDESENQTTEDYYVQMYYEASGNR
jgi:hypothetical protein